jgi:molybdopterin molybdotransferase
MPAPESMKGFAALTMASEALRKLFEVVPRPRLETEECDLTGALHRVLAEDEVCPFDVPQFDRSTVDGYAVKAVDTTGSSPTNPSEFQVVGKVVAGSKPNEIGEVRRGESALVLTGSPMPAGTDSVVMVEHCTRSGGIVLISRQVHPIQNVSRKGEDYSKNETMVAAGTILKPWHIAAVASVGRAAVKVRRRLGVGVLSTGSEIVEPGRVVQAGQVANSTKPLLLTFAKQRGCREVDLGTVPDNVDEITRSIKLALQECDIVLTTGGSSVGERDLVSEAISQIGGSTLVAHGIRIRPGRPTGVSVIDGKPVFVLSGFPVAAMAGFQALVEPTISFMTGAVEDPAPKVRGTLTRRVSNDSANRCYVRVRVSRGAGGLDVDPLVLTGSGLISTLTKANGLLVIDETVEGYDEGEEVEVLLTGAVLDSRPTSGGVERSGHGSLPGASSPPPTEGRASEEPRS